MHLSSERQSNHIFGFNLLRALQSVPGGIITSHSPSERREELRPLNPHLLYLLLLPPAPQALFSPIWLERGPGAAPQPYGTRLTLGAAHGLVPAGGLC